MASREEIEQLIKQAYAAGDMEDVDYYSDIYNNMDYGPLGLGDNFARAGQSVSDSARVISDTMTRGYGDKGVDLLAGGAAKDATEASRDRLGLAAIPLDVGAAVLSSGYRIPSALWGGVTGAAEGVASEYGHQDNWIPSMSDLGSMAWEGAKGATLGAVGYGLGDVMGQRYAGRQAKAAQPFKDDAALRTAADEAHAVDPLDPRAVDLKDRVSRVEDVRNAKGRDDFANLRAGSPEEAAYFSKVAKNKKTLSPFAADQIERLSLAKGRGVGDANGLDYGKIARMGLDLKTTGGVGMGLATGADLLGVPAKLRTVPARETERAAALVRDPRGIGLTPDQATINAWRENASKMFSGYGRIP